MSVTDSVPNRPRRAIERGLARAVLNAIVAIVAIFAVVALPGCALFTGESPPSTGQAARADPGETQLLLAVGDMAFCNGKAPAETDAFRTAALAQLLLAGKPAAVILTLGDNVYEIGDPKEYAECFQPTWGKLKDRLWPTPGNHDYGVPGAHGYFDYFGASAGPDRTGYYRKTLGAWTVFSLNSNIDSGVGSAQYRWLQAALAESKTACILAAWHHPVFTSAPRGNVRKMIPLFELLAAAKADLILQGHEHHYERFAAMTSNAALDETRGVVSMVAGTGGAPPSRFVTSPHPGSEARVRQFGVLKLELSAGSADWQFVNAERQVLDRGRLRCKTK